MSKLDTKQRAALPESDFGDPARRLFPIVDQNDVDSAAHLIGKAKNPEAVRRRIISIAKRKGFSIPEAWKTDAAMADDGASPDAAAIDTIAMIDLGAPEADDEWSTYNNALLFRAGEYPEKDYTMSPEELWAAVEQFAGPVENELDHVKTKGTPLIVDGQLGCVESIVLSDDGTELRGKVKIPRWLDKVWDRHLAETGKTAKQVSCVWDRASKSLKRLGLAVAGHVPEAVLMAAFADAHPDDTESALGAFFATAHATPHGRIQLQQIHDMAASVGAICDPANSQDPGFNRPVSLFVSSRERSGFQKIHDLAATHGARCSVMMSDPDKTAVTPTAATGSPTPPPPAKPSRKAKETRPMSLKENFLALFGKADSRPEEKDVDAFLTDLTAEAAKAVPAPVPAPVASFADSPEGKALQAKADALQVKADAQEAKLAKMERDALLTGINVGAAAFAETEIKAMRALPSERPNLVAMFTQAALDDMDTPREVTFAAGDEIKTGSRVDAVRAMCAARPTHNLFMNMLKDSDIPNGSAVFAAKHGDEETRTDEAKVNAYLSRGDIGRMALEMKAKNRAVRN